MARLRIPDLCTGLAGLVLLVSLWLPWYEVSDGTVSGWSALAVADIWLFLTALTAVALVVVTARRDEPSLPVFFDVITTWASFVATILALIRLLAPPAELDRSWGVVVALLAAAAVLACAFWAMRRQEQPGLRPPPEVRAMPAPPSSAA